MHSELELKSCPFCGGNASAPQDRASVSCLNGACTVNPSVSAFSRARAIEFWNRREASTRSTGGSEAKPVAWRWNAGDDNYPDAYQFAVTKEIAEMRAGLVGAKPDPLYTSPPGGSEAAGVKAVTPLEWPDIHAYVEGYEWRGDGDYTPNEQERTLIEDAIHGYVGEVEQVLGPAPSSPEGIAARDAVIEDIAQRLVVLALGIEQVPFDRRSVRRGIAELAVEAARALRSPGSSKA